MICNSNSNSNSDKKRNYNTTSSIFFFLGVSANGSICLLVQFLLNKNVEPLSRLPCTTQILVELSLYLSGFQPSLQRHPTVGATRRRTRRIWLWSRKVSRGDDWPCLKQKWHCLKLWFFLNYNLLDYQKQCSRKIHVWWYSRNIPSSLIRLLLGCSLPSLHAVIFWFCLVN